MIEILCWLAEINKALAQSCLGAKQLISSQSSWSAQLSLWIHWQLRSSHGFTEVNTFFSRVLFPLIQTDVNLNMSAQQALVFCQFSWMCNIQWPWQPLVCSPWSLKLQAWHSALSNLSACNIIIMIKHLTDLRSGSKVTCLSLMSYDVIGYALFRKFWARLTEM